VDPQPAPRTLTFLFPDLEGSTQLWERFPHAMKPALARYDTILRTAGFSTADLIEAALLLDAPHGPT
jgi:class 3 adenylate cyclase